MRLSKGYITSNIWIFTGLNGKIEWCEQGFSMRLNGEIERFLHEAEWGSCTRLSKAASDRKLSVCLSKMWFIPGLTFLELKQAVRRSRIKLNVIKKENQQLRVSRALFRSVFDCTEWGSIPAIKGNPPHPQHP